MNNRGQYGKVTDLARTMLGYAGGGGSLKEFANLFLYKILVNHPGMEAEGIYGLSFAYIAGFYSITD